MCGPRPDPDPWFPLVTASVGDPVTVTASLYLTLTDRVNPADLSAAVVIHSTSVTSAAPMLVVKLPIATKISGAALVLSFPVIAEPASTTQPSVLAYTSFFWASVSHFGFDSSASEFPHNGMILPYK